MFRKIKMGGGVWLCLGVQLRPHGFRRNHLLQVKYFKGAAQKGEKEREEQLGWKEEI